MSAGSRRAWLRKARVACDGRWRSERSQFEHGFVRDDRRFERACALCERTRGVVGKRASSGGSVAAESKARFRTVSTVREIRHERRRRPHLPQQRTNRAPERLFQCRPSIAQRFHHPRSAPRAAGPSPGARSGSETGSRSATAPTRAGALVPVISVAPLSRHQNRSAAAEPRARRGRAVTAPASVDTPSALSPSAAPSLPRAASCTSRGPRLPSCPSPECRSRRRCPAEAPSA